MSQDSFPYEASIRLAFFVSVLLLMVFWEFMTPKRKLTVKRGIRWLNNVTIVVINTLLLRAVFFIAAMGVAIHAEQEGWGLFNVLNWTYSVTFILSVVLLDLIIYLQHVLFHAVPVLWRLHRMHHADLDFDTTTGIRFHPVEILLSMAIKMGAVAALGTPPLALLTFEVLLNATSMFNHGNVHIPGKLDGLLRLFVVTPDMHRVHHSIIKEETDSNFGFNLPWWDRLLGTYRSQPSAGHQGMTIGIDQFRTERELWLDRMLIQPFLREQFREEKENSRST